MKRSKLTLVLTAMLLAGQLLPVAASAATVQMYYGGGAIYLRTGPGTNYGENGVVRDGDWVEVLSYGGVWSQVRTSGGRVGYIKNLYINDGNGSYAAGTSYFGSGRSVYTTADVNLRAGASTTTSVITTLGRGTKLTALGTNGGFYLVQTAGGTQGYVNGSYISEGKPSAAAPSGGAGWTKVVTASWVNVRAGGGMHYGVLGKLPRGTAVEVIQVGNYWTRVRCGSLVGWIKNDYLR